MHRLSEVVFPISRAVEEDDSDGETTPTEPVPNPVFRWNKKSLSQNGFIDCQCLIIAIGPVSTGFIDHVFGADGREMVCSVCCGGSNMHSCTWSQKAPSDSSTFLWRCKGRPGLLLCQCRESVCSQQSFSWVEQLFKTAKPSNVVILDALRIGELKSGSELLSNGNYCRLLALRSSALTTKPCCPFLEPPNTVGGLGAEILTNCEVERLPAVLYTAYVSVRDPLNVQAAAFSPVLSCSTIKPHVVGLSEEPAPDVWNTPSSYTDTGSLYI